MSRHYRIWAIIALVPIVFLGGTVYYLWQTRGMAEMRQATERIAGLLASGDRNALLQDPLFEGDEHTVDWLLERKGGLRRGYRVSVVRNGGGHTVLTVDDVSHLGEIEWANGSLTLAMWYDPDSEDIKLVTCAGSGLTVSAEEPKPTGITVGPVTPKRHNE